MAKEQLRIILSMDTTQLVAGATTATTAIKAVDKAAAEASKSQVDGAKKAEEAVRKQTKAQEDAAKKQTQTTKQQQQQQQQQHQQTQREHAEQQQLLNARAEATNKIGNAMIGLGAVSIGAAAMAGKAAIDWESAYAGVRKTVNGTADEMKALEGQLRNIALTTPGTHKEIAAVAEAAGQLGVKRQDVAQFTETMIALGVATNITAEEGAMELRQFMNIMGSAAGDVDNIASTIVELGNNSATTEKDILTMGQRLAGVGKQMHFSEADVLAFAAAMASVGIEAEAGGTAMTQTLKQINRFVLAGGDELETLAKVAGMTSQEFAKAWGQDAAGATNSFIVGLGQMQARGEDVNKTLGELKIKGVRQTDTIIRLAGATKAMGGETDLLAASLKMASAEFANNQALQKEAMTRYGTTAQQAAIARNQIADNMISIGNALMPTINSVIKGAQVIITAFSALPAPITNSMGAILLFSGGLLVTIGVVMKAQKAIKALAETSKLLGTSIGGLVGKGALVSVALGAVIGVVSLFMSQKIQAKKSEESFAEALDQTNGALKDQSGAYLESIRAANVKQLADSGLLEKAKELGVSMEDTAAAALGEAAAKDRVTEATKKYLATQSGYDEGSAQSAHDNVQNFNAALETQASALTAAKEKHDALAQAQTAGASTEQQAAKATAEAAREKAQYADAVARARQEVEDLITAQFKSNDIMRASLNLELGANQATLDGAAAVKEFNAGKERGTNGLNTHTEAGIKNNRVMMQMSEAYQKHYMELAKTESSIDVLNSKHAEYRNQLIQTAHGMGLTGAAAEAYVDKIFKVPNTVETKAIVDKALAEQAIAEWQQKLGAIPKDKLTQLQAMADKGQLANVKSELDTLARDRQVFMRVKYSVEGSPIMSGAPANGAPVAKAQGGPVYGPGTSTSDSIPALLSNGEYVIRAAAVDRLGLNRLNYLNNHGELPRFATGGYVGNQLVSNSSRSTVAEITNLDALPSAVRSGMEGMAFSVELDGRVIDARVRSVLSDTARTARR